MEVSKNCNIRKAYSYLRLSKEDGDKSESDSIANQRKLIQEYILSRNDIILVGEKLDDGYTGANFNRPGFHEMMDELRNGKADCVIVKDLSRFGRDYIGAGNFIQKEFPKLGIRFIAINDAIDSEQAGQSNDLIIPFKNLINDNYCRDLSNKLRGQFRVQRMNGEYVGPYVAYGYMKSPADRHKIIIDENVAGNVREIFNMKIAGYSNQNIAARLNLIGILSPSVYKKSIGINYKSGFQSNSQNLWSVVAINRILRNRIYIGSLEQGKRSTPNYKVKKMQMKDSKDWIVIDNNHEPIISNDIFLLVQKLLTMDTRTSPLQNTIYPLSGLLFCADCNKSMIRRSVRRGNKDFYYYVCSTHKKGNGCSSHMMEQYSLEQKIMNAICKQIEVIVELKELLKMVGNETLKQSKIKKLDALVEQKNTEIDKKMEYRFKLYESKVEGMISHDEYVEMRHKYSIDIEKTQISLMELKKERDSIMEDLSNDGTWMQSFLKFRNVTVITRDLIVSLIDRVYVSNDKAININFRFHDEFKSLVKFIDEELKGVC